MSKPNLKVWKSWVGVEAEGNLVGANTVFVISNDANPLKLVQAKHLYVCPEVTELSKIKKWCKVVKPYILTLSLPINERTDFAKKVRAVCNKNKIKFNYQVFIKYTGIRPNTVRLDWKPFENESYACVRNTTIHDYKNDRRLE